MTDKHEITVMTLAEMNENSQDSICQYSEWFRGHYGAFESIAEESEYEEPEQNSKTLAFLIEVAKECARDAQHISDVLSNWKARIDAELEKAENDTT